MTGKAIALGLVLTLSLGACGDDDESTELPSSLPTHVESAPPFGVGKALLDNGEGSILIDIEVAETPEQHQFGLMFQESIPDEYGMAFIYFEEQAIGFHMKDTLIPLSIAYFDKEGRILSILDMEPCESDPCETYPPGAPYIGALEVKQGMFDEWNIEVGDQISIQR